MRPSPNFSSKFACSSRIEIFLISAVKTVVIGMRLFSAKPLNQGSASVAAKTDETG